MEKIIVKKKRKGFTEEFIPEKIHSAIRKSSERILQVLTDEDCEKVSNLVLQKIGNETEVTVRRLHNMVEVALDEAGFHRVAESYRQYRNYKEDAQKIMEAVDKKTLELSYKEDKSNANCDSTLVSTKRSILYGEQQKEKYERIFLGPEELEAVKDGFIYVHDRSARWDTYNCSVVNYKKILKGGFVLSNTEYNEPQSAAAAIAVLSDAMNVVASNQYGGNTVPEVDDILDEYCEKSYKFYIDQYKSIVKETGGTFDSNKADKFAEERVRREVSQGLQGIELTYNSVSSSRGDFPFLAFTFGHSTSRWARLVASEIMRVRKNGQGKPGHKVPVVFPKLIFLYDSDLHGPGKELEDLFLEAVECTKVAQYPDYLSLDLPEEGETPNYVGEVYHKWGKIVSPMGCRSFLSPMFKNSGTWEPQDDNDEFLIYRCNIGVIALNLPMIYQKSKVEGKEYHEVLDYYLEMVRGIHKRTFSYLSKLKASSSPLVFCEGGFDGGDLKPEDSIGSVLKNSTASFGYGGLNELSLLMTKKPLHENPEIAKELKYINDKTLEFKKEDGILYSPYGIPGESALPLMNEQFIKKYGEKKGIIIKGGYLSNSFHCAVIADITPIEKMNIESRFWDYSNGGKISHIRINNIYNTEGIISLIRYGMSKGLYLGVNHPEDHCISCGHHWSDENDWDDTIETTCPVCGSTDIIKIRRMNGYLSYTRTRSGKARFHEGKLKEIKDRKNM